MTKKPLGTVGTIWFTLLIEVQWIMYIECLISEQWQDLRTYFMAGVIGTALYLWLAISKSKASWIAVLLVAGINALMQTNGWITIISLSVLAITLFLTRQAITEKD